MIAKIVTAISVVMFKVLMLIFLIVCNEILSYVRLYEKNSQGRLATESVFE